MDTYDPYIFETPTKIPLNFDSSVSQILPESFYILRAVMKTIERLQHNIGQTLAVGTLLSKPDAELTEIMQKDAWSIMLELIYKIKTHGDLLELTIHDELKRFKN